MHSLDAHKILKNHTKPNYLGAQIPILSKLNPDVWSKKLENYWDWQIPYFIKFGFPLDVKNSPCLDHDLKNHPSANQFPDHIDTYLAEEIAQVAIVGPFKEPPMSDLHV